MIKKMTDVLLFSIYGILWSIIGLILAVFLTLIPGLHVYNVMGFAFLGYLMFMSSLDPFYFAMFLIGLVVGYSVIFSITSIYLSVPDDSTVYVMYPAQKYLIHGRGHEAIILMGIGSLVGLFVIVLMLPPAMGTLALIREIVKPHLFWIVGAVMVYILMSEFPKDVDRGTRGKKLWRGWSTLLAGYLTFFLSGLLGIVIFNSTLIPVNMAFQSLSAVFIGMFAVSTLLVQINTQMKIPKQHYSKSTEVTYEDMVRGNGAGILGGFFVTFFPALTAGVGALLAGHATASKGERNFILSQGANRVLYYVGSVFLFFSVVNVRKGALTIGLNLFIIPERTFELYLVVAAIAITGALAFLLLFPLSKLVIKLIESFPYRKISIGALIIVIVVVFLMTGFMGLVIMAISTAIGLIPVVFHSRRMNCLAVIIVPIFINMAGLGAGIGGWFG